MKKSEFTEAVSGLVWVYINNVDMKGRNAMIKVNPELLYVDLLSEKEFLDSLAYAQEATENAAYAHDAAQYEAADYQAAQNPDYYRARDLTKTDAEGKTVPDPDAIERMAEEYFPVK